MSGILEEWQELAEEYKKLESANDVYLKKMDELTGYQQQCLKLITHQRSRMSVMSKNLSEIPDSAKAEELKNNMMKREVELQSIEQTLPKDSGKYLKVVLGNVNVSFMNKEEKFKYKDDYEKFKLICNFISFFLAILNMFIQARPLEILLMFMLVWYYCTVSIRESILKVNGSKIKGWWRLHHVLSTIAAGILLVWPENESWYKFRYQFMFYTIYNSLIQYLQFKYQRGVLYRLKALGERHNMDLTIEGFHSWMWRGLTFLLPFLFIGYMFQLANAVALFRLGYSGQATWHVTLLSLMFFVFFVGNTTTTLMVVPTKTKQNMMLNYRIMRQRLSSMVKEKTGGKNGVKNKTK